MSNELAKQISYILYSSPEEDVKVMALVKDETIWLTQKAMAELFDCSADNISLHLKNVFASGELEKKSVTEEISATASDGKNYRMNFYNLDGNGKVSRDQADEKSFGEYEIFNRTQKIDSDFDKVIRKIKKN